MAVKNPTQLDFILVGDFEVHKHGCRDVTRAIKAKVTDYTEPGVINVDPTDTYLDVVRFLYDDQIAESYSPDEDADKVLITEATDDAPATYLPSEAWLNEHGYINAVHFNPCIRQWVSVTTQDCEGAGKEWKSAEGLKNSTALECPTCHTTAGELGLTPRKRNGKWRPLVPAHQIEVEEVRTPESPAPASAKNGNGKAEAKRLLATLVARSIAQMLEGLPTENSEDSKFILANFSQEEAAITAATWVHHIPADRERWVAMGLPKPDRSDWR